MTFAKDAQARSVAQGDHRQMTAAALVARLVPAGVLAAAAVTGVPQTWPRSGATWVSSVALALGALLLFAWAAEALALVRLVRERRAAPPLREPRISGHRPLQELRTI